MPSNVPTAKLKRLGKRDYQACLQAMREFTEQRSHNTPDEFWLVEHPPVYTLGQAGKKEHVLSSKHIPVIQSDRGGQVTYHGPGQIVIYILVDIKRLGIGARALVSAIENALIATLKEYQLEAFAKQSAPGVYIYPAQDHSSAVRKDAKIAALGLRIRKGCSYHGLSLNVNMDLSPFQGINPCGYEGQMVCQLSDFIKNIQQDQLEQKLVAHLSKQLGLKI